MCDWNREFGKNAIQRQRRQAKRIMQRAIKDRHSTACVHSQCGMYEGVFCTERQEFMEVDSKICKTCPMWENAYPEYEVTNNEDNKNN